jgi:hypothetical protein
MIKLSDIVFEYKYDKIKIYTSNDFIGNVNWKTDKIFIEGIEFNCVFAPHEGLESNLFSDCLLRNKVKHAFVIKY